MTAPVEDDAPTDELARPAFDVLPVGIAILDADGVVRSTNAAWGASGRGNDAAIQPDAAGVDYIDACEEADDGYANAVAAGLRSVVAGEEDLFAIEYPRHVPDGRRWFLLRAAPFEHDGDRYVGVAHVDVTDGEPVGEGSRPKERAMAEAPIGITISDPSREGNPLIYANEAFERITGYPVEYAVGRNCRFLQGPDTDEETVATMREAIENEDLVKVEVVNYRRNGERFWNEVTIAPVHDGMGETTHFVGFQADVTARKEAELELEDQRETLAVLNQIVRHDIPNDMGIVLGWADSLAEDADGETEEILNRVIRSSQHVVELTHTLGDLVETLTGDADPDLGPIDLGVVLREEIEKVATSYEWRAEDVEIDGTDDADGVEVVADDLLSSVFSNLLNNAVLHNDGPRPRIDVSATVDGETVAVEVADNGPGIPDDRKEAVFGRGEKGLESPGTGLGLYLVDTLVGRYGGDVDIEDNDPEGTVVRVTLRRA